MVEIAENEKIKLKLWQWAGGIGLGINILRFLYVTFVMGHYNVADYSVLVKGLILGLVIFFCIPFFSWSSKKVTVQNLYGKIFVVGFVGWTLFGFIQFLLGMVLLLGVVGFGNKLFLVSLLKRFLFGQFVFSIVNALIYMVIAVLLLKYKKKCFVEISDNADNMVIPEENDKESFFIQNGEEEEVDQSGKFILRWGRNSLLGFILGIPISLCVLGGISAGMFILLYFTLVILFLLPTSVVGVGVFALAGKNLEIQDVLIKSIIIGVVGYSLYYFEIYSVIYSEAISAAHIESDRQSWIYMTCVMHVAVSAFSYVFLMAKEQRKEIFLIGAPLVLFYCLYWYAYF